MTSVPFHVIDAFTHEPFRGNPAAVCWLEAPRPPSWMQAVAAEFNLSETAFVEPRGETFSLRWFTPTIEVPLCGHATLASAHMLYATGRWPRAQPVRFETRSGLLGACADPAGIALDFPALPGRPADPPAALVAAVGVQPIAAQRIDRPGTDPIWLLELESEAAVRAAVPGFAAMVAAAPDPVVITAAADREGPGSRFDFVSRFFAPGHGIDEDPVTGTGHCVLGPYWAAKLGRRELSARQVSRRSGEVLVRMRGDRVGLIGAAVIVSEGRLVA